MALLYVNTRSEKGRASVQIFAEGEDGRCKGPGVGARQEDC